ncbi:MAG TPA: hypothetical protein PLQ76_06510, partial [bacterium]|nr:hypothetical protein [bacterium]
FGGFDYPLLRGKEADINQMSVMLEGDTKAFYLGTHRTLSLGLRYAFADRGEASLSIADLARTNTMVLKGAYNF